MMYEEVRSEAITAAEYLTLEARETLLLHNQPHCSADNNTDIARRDFKCLLHGCLHSLH